MTAKTPKRKIITNPNKINQYTAPDPRQTIFLSYYLDPKSETFSNILQSGLRAGYSQKYSENLKVQMPAWFGEKLEESRHERLLAKAERNLDEFMDINHIVPAMGPFGPIINKKTKKPYLVTNSKILAIKEKATEFIAEGLGKKFYGKPTPANNTIIPIQINNTVQTDKEAYQ